MVLGKSAASSAAAARGVTEAYFGKSPEIVSSSVYAAVDHCRRGIFAIAYVEDALAPEFNALLKSQGARRPDQIVEYTMTGRRQQNNQSC